MSHFVPLLPSSLLTALLLGASLFSAEPQFELVKREEVQQRLASYKGKDLVREQTLKSFFQAAGCAPDRLSEQQVKDLKEPNLICMLPGTTDSVIVVGAHFDHVSFGQGVVDNWSGASLLPSLFEALKQQPRTHTFVFVAFAGEELGLVGSEFYVKNLPQEQRAKIKAFVNMDSLGLGPTKVWVNNSDQKLVAAMGKVAYAMKLPVKGYNMELVGRSDDESFRKRQIATITVHSVTQSTLPVLHRREDQLSAIKFDDFYDTYRLLSGYLRFLDETLAKGDR